MVLMLNFVYARRSTEQCLAIAENMYGQLGNPNRFVAVSLLYRKDVLDPVWNST